MNHLIETQEKGTFINPDKIKELHTKDGAIRVYIDDSDDAVTLFTGAEHACDFYLEQLLQTLGTKALTITVPEWVIEGHTHRLIVRNALNVPVYETSFKTAIEPFPDEVINRKLEESIGATDINFTEWEDKLDANGRYYRYKAHTEQELYVFVYPIVFSGANAEG